MVEVIPAILEKDFSEIEKKIRLVEGLVNWVQIDIADNTLVSNTTYLDPEAFKKFIGPADSSSSRHPLNFELHMMVSDPLRYLESFVKVGFKRFFAHVEGQYVDEYIAKCYQLGVEVGLAIDGPSDFDLPAGRQGRSLHQYMDDIDCILVMAIEAGESGRPYREDTAEKIKKIRDIDLEIPIAVDGAMNAENAAKVVAAGATRINSNSFIFGAPDVKMAIETLRNIK